MNIPQLEKLQDNKSIIFELQKILSNAIKSAFDYDIEPSSIELSNSNDEKFGDYACNVALKLAKELGKNPREIATTINNQQLTINKIIEKIEIAGPGFINIFLKKEYFIENLTTILNEKYDYGKWQLANEQVMMEFGQPNTHKAFHIGHLKSAITGLSIARLIRNLGYEVIQANYFGDVGMHVAKCMWGYLNQTSDFRLRMENEIDIHERMRKLDECYAFGAAAFKDNEQSEKEIREINKKIYDKTDEEVNFVYTKTRAWSIEHQTDVFAKLSVIYDRQYPESEIANDSLEIIKANIGKVFIEDQGAIIFPGEKYGLNNWVFITKDGNPSYSGKDMGLAYKKFKEYPNLSISLHETSVEQNDFFKGWFKAIELIDEKFKNKLYHIGHGWLLRQDKKKFSSRMGNTIKGIDILNEAIEFSLKKISESKNYSEAESKNIGEKVAIAGLKFLILSHEVHKDISYDPDQFLNPEGFSGPYILYSYVRSLSILRQSSTFNLQPSVSQRQAETFGIPEGTDLSSEALAKGEGSRFHVEDLNLINNTELSVLKLLTKYPTVTLEAGKNLAPHLVCNYLFELSQAFNHFYRENKVLVEDEVVKAFRLRITEAVGIVLKSGLNLLGVETVDQM
jgi:arginyl-tRNA synthetase